MKVSDDTDDTTKTTNERPVSLHPLGIEDALRALLKTPPPPKERDRKSPKKKQKSKGNNPA